MPFCLISLLSLPQVDQVLSSCPFFIWNCCQLELFPHRLFSPNGWQLIESSMSRFQTENFINNTPYTMVEFHMALRWWKMCVVRVTNTSAINPFFEWNILCKICKNDILLFIYKSFSIRIGCIYYSNKNAAQYQIFS